MLAAGLDKTREIVDPICIILIIYISLSYIH